MKTDIYNVDIDIMKDTKTIINDHGAFVGSMAQNLSKAKKSLTALCKECGINLKRLKQDKTKILTCKSLEDVPGTYDHAIYITKIYNVDINEIVERSRRIFEIGKRYKIEFDYQNDIRGLTFGEVHKVYYDMYGRWIERYELIVYPDYPDETDILHVMARRELTDYNKDAGKKFNDCDVIWCHDPSNVYHIPLWHCKEPRFRDPEWENKYELYDNDGEVFGFIHESELSKKEPDVE